MNHDLLKVHELVDGQLTQEDQLAVQAHIQTCPECQAELEAIQSLKVILKDKTETIDSKDSWKKCVKRLNEMDRAKRVEGFVGRYAWAMCTILFLVIASAATVNRVLGRNSVHTGDVAQMASGLVPIPSLRGTNANTNANNAQTALSKAVGPMPIAIKTTGMQVLGGASGLYNGRRVARLNMADQQGPITLIVMADTEGVDGSTQLEGRQQYSAGRIDSVTYVSWTEGKFTLVLLGERNPQDLCHLAEKICVR